MNANESVFNVFYFVVIDVVVVAAKRKKVKSHILPSNRIARSMAEIEDAKKDIALLLNRNE